MYFKKKQVEPGRKASLVRHVTVLILLLAVVGVLLGLELDQVLYQTEDITIRISNILIAVLILQFARFLDWLISDALNMYYSNRDEAEIKEREELWAGKDKSDRVSGSTVQYIVYVVAAILIIRGFNLNYPLSSIEEYPIRINHIFSTILIFLLAQLFSWVLIQLVLYRYYKRKKINIGSQFAINQLFKYVIYVVAAFIAIENLGIEMTVIWGGAAALLVGVGLGLQQTFNDFISGILLVFERSVEVGDVVEINQLVGTVKKIGLRTSLVETIDNITVIVPNSKLTVDNVVNWSHYDDKARFHVSVGVAYGSDTKLVKDLLIRVARNNIYVLKFPAPRVRFVDFGDSALSFELHFWSRNLIVIEDIKSDLRFEIDQIFRENNIVIPFPQRDVWFKNKPEA